MRTLYPLFILLLIFRNAGAQTHSNDYAVLSADAGTFFAARPGHDVATSFPYLVTASGGRHQETFDGTLKGKFTSPVYMAGLNLGYVWGHNKIDMGGGFFRSNGGDHGYYLKGGYGYSFLVGGLILRPAVDFYYLMGKSKMGTIDNSDVKIDLLGFTAYDQFTVEDDDGNDVTYNADHLDVNYRRFNLLANPKVVLSTRPLGRLIFGLELGWMLQLYQRCDLQLEQTSRSTSATYMVGKVRLDKNGSLGGAFAAINIGVRL